MGTEVQVMGQAEAAKVRVVVRLPKGFASAIYFASYTLGVGTYGDDVVEQALRRALATEGEAT